ncbi:MAG TPA: hypothetical protein VGC23_08145 [Vicinamibacterales bacterium]
MNEVLRRGLIVGLVLSAATLVDAQSPARPVERTKVQIEARQQIAGLEGALEDAVRQGTQMLNHRLQASNTDNMVMLAGLTRARGFRLDDYGVVFDVEFPSMRRSMVWSIQELEKTNASRAVRTTETVPAVRPREIYQTEIANALADAIVDYKGSVGIAPHEWLTVAARESVLDRRFVPGDPNDTAITVILRIKGSDLQALREGTLAREDGLKRVDVKHY